jgi:hypothetical protein
VGVGGIALMTPYHLTVLQLSEINYCAVVCPVCQTIVTAKLDQVVPVLDHCPSCQEEYDADLTRVLVDLRSARMGVRASKFGVEFHIREEAQTRQLKDQTK